MTQIPRTDNPWSRRGVTVDADGIARYDDLPASLVAMLAEQVAARPDSEAVVELGGDRLTYRQLWDRAAEVAGGLRAAGVGKGDRVSIRYPAGVNWTVAFFGTVFAGGIAVAPNIRSAAPEIAALLEDADVTVDLAADTTLPTGEPFVDESLTRSDYAAMFFTSGTTGRAKGVPTTHEAFLTNAENMIRAANSDRSLGEVYRTLISVPLFHVTGCNSQLLTALYVGGCAVIMPALDLGALMNALNSERISSMITVPAVYGLLLRQPAFADLDVSGVRWVGYGGAPIAPTVVLALKKAFPSATVMNGYGMTESASLMTVLPDGDAVDHADSVGYAVATVDLGVVPIGDDRLVGELVARGANVTAGYWNRPEADAATFIDGWLHTGDVVRVDDAGRVHIIDRTKDIINRGGENVSSVEVEAVLLAAPTVTDAAVLAVPDEVMGEKVGAVLVGDGDSGVDLDAVLAYCRENLADFKIPQYISIADAPLPRNAGGKLLKARMRGDVQWGTPLR
ncbi:class I adenylate-forming enzyme family protein [Jongsikchunia kroppenstedtii]|uniref:class I adenylate-forming enzyme family protein n=1 Tax=Jongsikchunia kroppenstedtii TaxID=1121721 RepID=UPI000477611F|nr:AMP-binding protein [Jongsikchunia kroppenstedtii]